MSDLGITSYAAYLPRYVLDDARLDPEAPPAARGRRSVAAYDEDSITLAVEAGRALGESVGDDGSVYLATCAAPYEVKTSATVVHEALGLDAGVRAVDLRGNRSGMSALELVTRLPGLAIASDVRDTRPGAPDELAQGDASVAFLGGTPAAASVVARRARTVEMLERWRLRGERHDRVWDERFTADLLVSAAREIVADLLAAVDGPTPDLVVVSSSNARAAATLRRALGSSGAEASLEAEVGFTGAAHPGLLLADAFDRAEPGQTILLVSATGGADAVLLRVGDGIRKARVGASVADQLAHRRRVSYGRYLRWRGLLEVQGPARPASPAPAAPPIHRRRGWKFRLEGSRCSACEAVTTPPAKVCAACGSQAESTPVSLRDRAVRVVSVTQDRLTTLPESAVALVIGDVDGGGRISGYAADVEASEVKVGQLMRPTFRLMWTTESIPNYFWKLRPLEDQTDVE